MSNNESSQPAETPSSHTNASSSSINTWSPGAKPHPLNSNTLYEDSLTLDQIMALPEHQHNELVKKWGVIDWETFTVQANYTPGDAYAHVINEPLPEIQPLPDEDDDEAEEEDDISREEREKEMPRERGEKRSK